MSNKGAIWLIPNTLGGENTHEILPPELTVRIQTIRHYAVEEIKSARRLLRKLDRNFPIDECTFYPLSKRSSEEDKMKCILSLIQGNDLGIISEAGCPGIADPGAELVSIAHTQNIRIHPVVGPSSFVLALMASGFSGNYFTFSGYLPKDRKDRMKKLKDMEMDVKRNGNTHIFMDTPFRNMHVLEDILNGLGDTCELCIAANLTLTNEKIQTYSVKEWRDKAYDISKIPVVFLIGKSQ